MNSTSMNPQQRARLIRSTKKLEAVLGTTPTTVDLAGRREARLFGYDEKSALSLKLKSSKARQPLPQPLILRLQSLPCDDKHASIISVAPRSPLSPTYTRTNTTDFRRKRMAKLARTLGENVPPELVFPSLADDNAVARRQLRAQRGRSWSVDGHPAIPPAFKVDGENNHDHLAPFIHIERTVSNDSDSTPKSSFDSAESFLLLHPGKGRRKEREWSGEWSHEMDNVIQRLRCLKRK